MDDAILTTTNEPIPLNRYSPQLQAIVRKARADRSEAVWAMLQSLFGRLSETDERHSARTADTPHLCHGHAV